jgi:hypothetical protein
MSGVLRLRSNLASVVAVGEPSVSVDEEAVRSRALAARYLML